MKNKLIIATRSSPLALWQANEVMMQLKFHHQGLEVELLPIKTKGDKFLDAPLAKVGGKGLFVKELEVAMLAGEADIAVHSMKDVPVDFPEGLHLNGVMKREDPRDAFVANNYNCIDDLPEGSVVGTSSLRRQAQLKTKYPSFTFKDLRGNVNTRLRKLDESKFDAIILASSGLKRLGFQDRIKENIDTNICLPAIGQGALGIECRINDKEVETLLVPLYDEQTAICLMAERAMNKTLNGGCQVPIAGFATLEGDRVSMNGRVAEIDGSNMLYSRNSSNKEDAEQLGIDLANDLLKQGARKILKNAGLHS